MKKFSYIMVIGLLLTILLIISTGCFFIPQGSIHVTSEPSGAKIYLNGDYVDRVTPSLISNISPGDYLLKVTLENEPTADEESITVLQNQVTSVHFDLIPEVNYRALCVGVDDYKDPAISDLRAPSFDVLRIKEVFGNSRFGDEQHTFSSIDTLIGIHATRDNILQSVASSFSEADSNDISYFYFSGHGWGNGDTSTILPYDANADNVFNDISAEELASSLGMIPGIKVVILDSCFSGGFIGKDIAMQRFLARNVSEQEYNNHILNAFALQAQLRNKNNLASDSFQVIVSASGDQECWETLYHPVDGNPYGYFSAALSQGCGYGNFNFPFPADTDNNRRITMEEAYQYIKSILKNLSQDVQVYPDNSGFSFIEY